MATKQELENELQTTKAENTAIMEMVKQLQEQIAELKQNGTNNVVVTTTQNKDVTRMVEVVSLLDHTFNLSTKAHGQGKVYTFESYGEKKTIRYTDMLDILQNYRKSFERGYAILTSKQDYIDLMLDDVYDSVFDFDTFKNIISLATDNAVDVILRADEDMQENIRNIIAQRIVYGETYDFNKLKKLKDNGIDVEAVIDDLTAETEENEE